MNTSARNTSEESPCRYPVMCEPELQEEVSDFDPQQRRALAAKLARWAVQLRLSAELIERGDMHAKPKSLPKDLVNMEKKDSAGCLHLAAVFEVHAAELRHHLGLGLRAEDQYPAAVFPN